MGHPADQQLRLRKPLSRKQVQEPYRITGPRAMSPTTKSQAQAGKPTARNAPNRIQDTFTETPLCAKYGVVGSGQGPEVGRLWA